MRLFLPKLVKPDKETISPFRIVPLLLGFVLFGGALPGCTGGASDAHVPAAKQGADQQDEVPDKDSKGPKHVLRKLSPQFVDNANPIKCHFTVTNDTNEPVEFTEIRSTCACAKKELGKKHLLPGEQTTLEVWANLHGKSGFQRVSCQLITKDETPPWTYTFELTVRQKAVFAPAPLLFGMLDPEKEVARSLELILWAPNEQELPQLLDLQPSSKGVKVLQLESFLEPQPDQTIQRRIPLKVLVTPDSSPGRGFSEIIATLSDGGGAIQANLSVIWNTRSLYSIVPARVFFGLVAKAKGELRKEVLVSRSDGRPLLIHKVTTSNPAASATVTKGAKEGEWNLMVALNPESITGPLVEQVILETDHPVQPQVTVPLSALP